MGIGQVTRAVFLDRDGTLNANVYYADSGEWESPRTRDALALLPGVIPALTRLQDAGFRLFLVTNQPSFAKGKTALANLEDVRAALDEQLAAHGIHFTQSYYCYHHPTSTVAGYGVCECRKPSPFFLQHAARDYGIDLAQSWMVGDRATDIACGQNAGTRTVFIDASTSIADAAELIVNASPR